MPLISAATAPTFTLPNAPHTVFIGLASPSRGAKETSVCRVTLAAGTPAVEHSLDREEVVVALAGRAVASFDGVRHEVGPGDALVVPAHQPFTLANPYSEPFDAVAVLPVGGMARMAGGNPFTPPWAE
jgi:mannose-6-phosphate isomerase-like protein (cupin superfamily)